LFFSMFNFTKTHMKSEQTGQYLWHSNWADVIPIMHHSQPKKRIFTHTALCSAPPPNTRLTYDTVWFSFEGGKDTEVKKLAFHRFVFQYVQFYQNTHEKWTNRSISMTFKLSRRNSHNAPFSTQKELCKAFLNYFLLGLALYSAPPPNTRLTYDTVWFSFEGGKDT
jgi:hypothetical protein